jgi:hypothetical protein
MTSNYRLGRESIREASEYLASVNAEINSAMVGFAAELESAPAVSDLRAVYDAVNASSRDLAVAAAGEKDQLRLEYIAMKSDELCAVLDEVYSKIPLASKRENDFHYSANFESLKKRYFEIQQSLEDVSAAANSSLSDKDMAVVAENMAWLRTRALSLKSKLGHMKKDLLVPRASGNKCKMLSLSVRALKGRLLRLKNSALRARDRTRSEEAARAQSELRARIVNMFTKSGRGRLSIDHKHVRFSYPGGEGTVRFELTNKVELALFDILQNPRARQALRNLREGSILHGNFETVLSTDNESAILLEIGERTVSDSGITYSPERINFAVKKR